MLFYAIYRPFKFPSSTIQSFKNYRCRIIILIKFIRRNQIPIYKYQVKQTRTMGLLTLFVTFYKWIILRVPWVPNYFQTDLCDQQNTCITQIYIVIQAFVANYASDLWPLLEYHLWPQFQYWPCSRSPTSNIVPSLWQTVLLTHTSPHTCIHLLNLLMFTYTTEVLKNAWKYSCPVHHIWVYQNNQDMSNTSKVLCNWNISMLTRSHFQELNGELWSKWSPCSV